MIGTDSVVKMGTGTMEQARYLQELPAARSPGVLATWRTGYAMEKLDEWPLTKMDLSRELMLQSKKILKEEFWCRAAVRNHGPEWTKDFNEWAEEYPWLLGYIERLYEGEIGIKNEVMIHGDPTLANCMARDGKVVFIDPIRPVGKIPNYPEVDMGKLLQSALGWEHTLDSELAIPWRGMCAELLHGWSPMNMSRAWFWCAVHYARILPYTTDNSVYRWSYNKSREIISAVRL